MDQDMNSYLEQLRARAEKRLQDTEPVTEQTVSQKVDDIVASVLEEKKNVSAEPKSDKSIDELMKEILPEEQDTKPFTVNKEDLDEESAQMMEDLVAWANRDPTIPFEPISDEDATELHEIVSELTGELPPAEEKEQTVEFKPSDEPEKKTVFSVKKKESVSEEPEEKTEDVTVKDEDEDEEDDTPSERELRRQRAKEKREEKRRAKAYRKALVEKENGSGRGIIGDILYVILFVLLVALTILAVLYLLQTIAGIKIIDVEAIFDIVFHWISSKILK